VVIEQKITVIVCQLSRHGYVLYLLALVVMALWLVYVHASMPLCPIAGLFQYTHLPTSALLHALCLLAFPVLYFGSLSFGCYAGSVLLKHRPRSIRVRL
jgi:hypothetical protein